MVVGLALTSVVVLGVASPVVSGSWVSSAVTSSLNVTVRSLRPPRRQMSTTYSRRQRKPLSNTNQATNSSRNNDNDNNDNNTSSNYQQKQAEQQLASAYHEARRRLRHCQVHVGAGLPLHRAAVLHSHIPAARTQDRSVTARPCNFYWN